jgi:hypothetical protein
MKKAKSILRKSLVVVVVVIFSSLAATSAINSSNTSRIKVKDLKEGDNDNNINLDVIQEKFIEAEITEYKSDGLTEKKIIPLLFSEVDELKTRLTSVETIEERFLILKESGLIPEESFLDYWKQGMYQKAEKIGLNKDNAGKIQPEYEAASIFRLPILLNFLCKINAIYILSGDARIGLPPFAGLIKFFGGSRILSFDLIDMCWGVFGMLETKGILRHHTMAIMPSFMCLAGFVGVHIHIPMVLNIYNGFSAMTFAVGLGPHSINFNLATSTLLGFILGGITTGILAGLVEGESS